MMTEQICNPTEKREVNNMMLDVVTRVGGSVRPMSRSSSEISIGCEELDDDHAPMETNCNNRLFPAHTNNKRVGIHDEDDDIETDMEPNSPSTSTRGVISPALSPVSINMDSYTYLSDDEYFRPLKRLAMSGSSPEARRAHSISPKSCSRLLSPQSCSSEPLRPLMSPPVIIRKDLHEIKKELQEENNRLAERLREEEKNSRLRSFSILDILSYKPSRRKSSIPVKIVRPWDSKREKELLENLAANKMIEDKSGSKGGNTKDDKGGALDALFQMTNKTIDNLNKDDKAESNSIFSSRQPPKKKRKSRTAFTNHQIFELEKRFLYQKYLSPADRDDLSNSLGLSNAQVITWFQNRRAKLKRDMEELKRDVENTSKSIGPSLVQGLSPALSHSLPVSLSQSLSPSLTQSQIQSQHLLEASVNMAAFLNARHDMPKLSMVGLPR